MASTTAVDRNRPLIPFTASTPGRILLAAAAVFLASAGVYLINGNLYAFGIGMPAGITLSFVGVGLGMADNYVRETLFTCIVMPVVLWGFMYLSGELWWRDMAWGGYVCCVLAGIALLGALMGGLRKPA